MDQCSHEFESITGTFLYIPILLPGNESFVRVSWHCRALNRGSTKISCNALFTRWRLDKWGSASRMHSTSTWGTRDKEIGEKMSSLKIRHSEKQYLMYAEWGKRFLIRLIHFFKEWDTQQRCCGVINKIQVFICDPALWYSVPSCNHWVGKASKNFKMMQKPWIFRMLSERKRRGIPWKSTRKVTK